MSNNYSVTPDQRLVWGFSPELSKEEEYEDEEDEEEEEEEEEERVELLIHPLSFNKA